MPTTYEYQPFTSYDYIDAAEHKESYRTPELAPTPYNQIGAYDTIEYEARSENVDLTHPDIPECPPTYLSMGGGGGSVNAVQDITFFNFDPGTNILTIRYTKGNEACEKTTYIPSGGGGGTAGVTDITRMELTNDNNLNIYYNLYGAETYRSVSVDRLDNEIPIEQRIQ